MAIPVSRRLLLAWTIIAAVGAELACNGGSAPAGRKVVRSGATRPYVVYLAGASNGAIDVRVDLEDGAYRIGTGQNCSQAVTKGSVAESELAEGRALFTDDRIAKYQAASVDMSGAGASAGSSAGGGGSLGDVQEGGHSDSGIPPDAGLPLPPQSCDSSVSHVTVWVYPEAGNNNVVVTFPPSGSTDPLVAEMVAYFEELATKYGSP